MKDVRNYLKLFVTLLPITKSIIMPFALVCYLSLWNKCLLIRIEIQHEMQQSMSGLLKSITSLLVPIKSIACRTYIFYLLLKSLIDVFEGCLWTFQFESV